MRSIQISNKPSVLHSESPAAAGKKQNAAAAVLSRAAEVYISVKGQMLSESAAMEEDLTPAEAALAANERDLADKRAKKAQAAEIEARIQTDKDLTDEDKAKLQKRADELKRAGMTDEDKLNELHDNMEKLDKLVTDGLATDKEIENQRDLYQMQIGQLKMEMKQKEAHNGKLRGQAIQERADRDAETAKAQEKEKDALTSAQADDPSLLAALRAYQKTAAGKKKADRSGIAVPTNKNTGDA